jgi:hypothetical protein
MSKIPHNSFVFEEYLDPQTNQTIRLKKIIKYERIEEAEDVCEINDDLEAAEHETSDEIRDDEYIDIDQLPNIVSIRCSLSFQ